jgi:HSP20 family molecular chaperone IbpA
MSRVPNLNSPFLLGFDEIERALDRVTRSASDGYPPYNIERLPKDLAHPERLRITLAVAGFTLDQLEITLEERQLLIRGRQHSFLLAEGMRVEGADLTNGLLSVDLARPEPERVVQKISITARD